MAQYQERPPKVRISSIPIKDPVQELGQASGISSEQARKVLLDAVQSISDADLRNLRGGQILVIM